MVAIEVAELRKRYGHREVLRGVDLRVAAGEVVAILGPNGAGKTTMVEILEGLSSRDSGSVRVLGEDPAHATRAFRERVGVVLQATSQEPFVSVEELLELHRSFYREPVPVAHLLAIVGLEDAAARRVRTLSGGQQRRLDVALALVGDPELVFLDEPTTGFDPAARLQAWDAIRSLRANGKTIVLTTHYLDEAEALADHVVVLADGRVVADGPPGSLGERHRAPGHISFAGPPGIEPSTMPLPVTVDNGRWTVTTRSPTAALNALTRWALDNNLELTSLTVSPPRLEDFYLEVTR